MRVNVENNSSGMGEVIDNVTNNRESILILG